MRNGFLIWLGRAVGTVAIMMGLALAPSAPASADTVLTVQGAERAVDLTRDDFAALPAQDVTTDTPWTEGTPVWSGPLLRDVYALAGIGEDDMVTVTALNDYAVTMPAADAFRIDNILAASRDGAALSVRDKGPFFIIYPFAADDGLRNEEIYSRSVWQVRRIELAR